MAYDFKFSVLMPVYNVEKYLNEAIDSIINQTIGFEENIELVIVDDESPDNSKEIALEYQEKYPKNIKVLSKPNGGQASAFNFGLKHLSGKYFSFIDSDDYVSLNTFEEVYDFFEEHYDEIDLVSIPIFFFERRSGPHNLNYKFNKTRVIDLLEEPSNILLSVSTSFTKKEAFEDMEFNTELVRGNDALMVNKILSSKKKLGVINSCVYNYRKRNDNTSVIDNTKSKKGNFTHLLKNFDFALIKYYLEKEGSVPKFIQYVVAYNLQWYKGIPDFLESFTKEEIDEFWKLIHEILSYIDEDVINDSIIIKQNYVRYFLMYLKNRQEFHIDVNEEESEIYLKTGDFIINKLHNHGIYLDKIDLDDCCLKLSGTFASSCDYNALSIEAVKTLPDGTEETYKDLNIGDDSNILRFLGIDWHFKHFFNLEIPIEEEEDSSIDLHIVYDEDGRNVVMSNRIKFRDSSMLADMINYFVKGSHIVSIKDNSLNVCPYSDEKAYEMKQELFSYIQEILESEKELKRENRSLNRRNKSLDMKNKSLNRKNEKLMKKNEKLKEGLKKSRDKNKDILNSTSWKVTKPLRVPRQMVKKIK